MMKRCIEDLCAGHGGVFFGRMSDGSVLLFTTRDGVETGELLWSRIIPPSAWVKIVAGAAGWTHGEGALAAAQALHGRGVPECALEPAESVAPRPARTPRVPRRRKQIPATG